MATRDEIIGSALFLLGRVGENETPSTAALNKCAPILNSLVKHWETQGLHVWTASYGTLFLNANQRVYNLDTNQDHGCDDDTLTETVLTSSAAGTSLSVEDSGNTEIDYVVGILLNTGVRFWTTATNVVGNTITLNESLPYSADAGNTVVTYSVSIGKPLKILNSVLNINTYSEIGMDVVGRTAYNNIVVKNSLGSPNILYYAPGKTSGKYYVWPVPTSSDYSLKISYLRKIDIFATGSDEQDLPPEWELGLTYNLARMAAPAYGVDLQRKDLTDIIAIAQQSLEELKAWDSDTGSTFIRPDIEF